MTEVNDNLEGLVLRIERSSVYDGDGFRTVVFLKGCPLRCEWCSTPEGQSFRVEHAGDIVYGKIMTVEHVMSEIRKDSAFYFHSGGGMTLSGGEMLSQPEFSYSLLRKSYEECINTAIETCFFAKWETIASMLPFINTAFVDMKFYDSEKHKKYCAIDNKLIMENLLLTNDISTKFKLVVRIPIIPGINDNREELENIGSFCSGLKQLDHVQLLPYHRLGVDTYRKLGRKYPLADLLTPAPDVMAACKDYVSKFVEKVIF